MPDGSTPENRIVSSAGFNTGLISIAFLPSRPLPCSSHRRLMEVAVVAKEELMKSNRIRRIAVVATLVWIVGGSALSDQDRYALKVPGGLAFAEFRGYESWPLVAISQNGALMAAILGNPAMIEAYRAGVPGNGKSFPDGAKMAKVHWNPTKLATFPAATVPGTQHDVDFMVKDSKRFADSGGWGWAVFDYDAGSGTFAPGTSADKPPQGHDARCGFACHTTVKNRDFVFTEYGKR
jgi:hypothetical protein